jgi:hypothetical protein
MRKSLNKKARKDTRLRMDLKYGERERGGVKEREEKI